MDFIIYKVRGKNGYLYDMSMNPAIDFEILKRTRNIDRLEIITPVIPIEYCKIILNSIYGLGYIFAKVVKSEDLFANNVLKKLKIKRIQKFITKGISLPSYNDISKVEELISGRALTLEKLFEIKHSINISNESLRDIIQVLYCERRIKITPAFSKVKGNIVCEYCGITIEDKCCRNLSKEDILIYAADNYSINIVKSLEIKKNKLDEALSYVLKKLLNFMISKKTSCVLFCAPNSFKYDLLIEIFGDVIKKGGRILYATSVFKKYEVFESFKSSIMGAKIERTNGMFTSFKNLDILVCAYNENIDFYKAFDLVVFDERYAFIENPLKNTIYIYKKIVKERGKFIHITSCPKIEKSIFKNGPEIIELPVTPSFNPIPEPRIIISRYLKGPSFYIPPMAVDIIRWSMGEGKRTIIFVPDEDTLDMTYRCLTEKEDFDRTIIDFSSKEHKTSLISFEMGQVKVLISSDFKDALNINYNVNVVVINCDNTIFKADTLVNISGMAVMQGNKSCGEVVFVAKEESDAVLLAKETIRNLNKTAWEMGYIKK